MAGSSAQAKVQEERVRSLAEPVLARHGAELVELIVARGRSQLVRLVADREGGIDLETCARISEEVSRLLDAEDPISGRYTLEVTSPGLNRPLRTESDFRKNAGRKVRVVLARSQHEGIVKEVTEEAVTLATDHGDVDIPLRDVAKAKLLLPW
ncbi:MAG: ribosome maturation factor RimP [Actinomycetota bacterium]|nr:ribosome maturation factor RimP [Actinomycetota bacterium]